MQAAKAAQEKCSALSVKVFSDRDIDARRAEIESALSEADVFFGSLLFDYDQVCPCDPKILFANDQSCKE